MPMANLEDVNLYYEFSGAEHLPIVLLSNGLGTNIHMWDGQIDALIPHFRLLRYDMRGHGQSGLTPGPYTIEQLSWDVVRLLDALGLKRVSFCGLSMGGMIGMFLGSNVADRLHKLLLCNTASKFDPEHMWNKRIEAVRNGGMKAVAESVLERWLTPGFRASHPAEAQSVLSMLESANPEGYVACCAAVRDMDLRSAVPKISVPTLVVTGTSDVAAPPAAAQLLAKSIPGAAYTEFAAAHLSNIEARDEFNRRVEQFLLV